jgi:hypothetical protein
MSGTDWLAEVVDVNSTRDAYASHAPSRCDCCYCRNFFAAMPALFDKEVLAFLRGLGIDPEDPSEVIHYLRTPKGHLYEALYRAFGTLPGERGTEAELDPISGIQIRCSTLPLFYDEAFGGRPCLTIHMLCEGVKWLIDHEEPPIAGNPSRE